MPGAPRSYPDHLDDQDLRSGPVQLADRSPLPEMRTHGSYSDHPADQARQSDPDRQSYRVHLADPDDRPEPGAPRSYPDSLADLGCPSDLSRRSYRVHLADPVLRFDPDRWFASGHLVSRDDRPESGAALPTCSDHPADRRQRPDLRRFDPDHLAAAGRQSCSDLHPGRRFQTVGRRLLAGGRQLPCPDADS